MRLRFLLQAILLFVFTTPLAQAFHPADFNPNVVDETGTLSPSEVHRLNEEIQKLREKADVWSAIYLIETLDGETIESAAEKTFLKWKLGRKGQDNGLLLMFALRDRRARIEVGYGLEGDITDLHARRVLDNVILPRFKSAHYSDGLVAGLHAIGYLKARDASFLETAGGVQLKPEDLMSESPTGIPSLSDHPDIRRGLHLWFAWVGILIFFPILSRALEQVCKGGQPARSRSFLYWMALDKSLLARMFFAINPGVFIAFSPRLVDQFLDGRALSLENWGIWMAIVMLSPAIVRGVSFWIGRRRANKNPVFRLSKAPLLLFILDLEGATGLGKKLFLAVLPGLYIAAVPAFWEPDYEAGYGTWLGWTFFILYLVVQWFGTVAPLISGKSYRRSEARKRLNRIKTRIVGTREVFGKRYTHTPSVSSSSKSSRFSSSSGGGRSGGGGASSSW